MISHGRDQGSGFERVWRMDFSRKPLSVEKIHKIIKYAFQVLLQAYKERKEKSDVCFHIKEGGKIIRWEIPIHKQLRLQQVKTSFPQPPKEEAQVKKGVAKADP